MSENQKAIHFWHAYLATLPGNHLHKLVPIPPAGSFGYGEEMGDELGDLVLKGIKRATCGRYLGENLLDYAGLAIVLDGRGLPLCLTETYEVTVRQYQDIDEEWAQAEGEGDGSLQYWQEGHWEYFTEEAKLEGYTISQDMLLKCERFRLIYPLPKT